MSDIMYGCINEDEFSLRGPRTIEGDECKTLGEAFLQAMDMVNEEGVQAVSICRCKYYGEDGNGYWGELQGDGQISIDASGCEEWLMVEVEE